MESGEEFQTNEELQTKLSDSQHGIQKHSSRLGLPVTEDQIIEDPVHTISNPQYRLN